MHPHRGVGRLTEGDDVLVREAFRDPLRAGVVGRDHDELAGAVGEVDERLLERVARTVVVEVVGVDVGDQCDGGVVEQERAVGLVGLDDEQVVGARRRRDAELFDDAAVDEARVGAERAAGR